MTERHKTVLPQRDLISWKSKASVFPTRKQEHFFSQIKSNSSVKASRGRRRCNSTNLSAAVRIILLQPLSTWEEGMCVCVCVLGVGGSWRWGVGEKGGQRRERGWYEVAEVSPWRSLRPWLLLFTFTGSGQRPRDDLHRNRFFGLGEAEPACPLPSQPHLPSADPRCPLLTQDLFTNGLLSIAI